MDEQAKQLENKYKNKQKKVPLIHKDHQHFDSASYEQNKQQNQQKQ